MSATRRPERGRVSLGCGRLLLLTALLLGGIARPGAAQGPAVSFLPPITYERPIAVPLAGADGVPLLTADLDGDGRLDLVVFTKDGISILYGNGDGTFAAPIDYALGQNLQEGTAADVNGDGLMDLVICDRGLNKMLVLLNRGGRTFSAPISYPVGAEPLGVTAGDFNGDGAVDLAVSCGSAGAVSVLINRGDGTFEPPVFYGGIQIPAGIVTADFDGDGRLDLAVTSLTGNVVQILLGDGKGKFRDGGRYSTGAGNANRLVTDDFNGDGIPDLAVASSGTLSLMFGDGTGRFGTPVLYDGYHLLDKGDFDGDGAPDLVTPGASANVGGFFIHLNREAGNFLAPMLIPGPGDKTGGVRVGDFNGDGRPDVVAWNVDSPHLAVFLNNTPQPTPAIRSLTLDAASVIGGCQRVTGTVTLTAPAPAQGAIGGLVVLLASSNPAVAVPAEILVPQGALQASFSVVTPAAAALQWASISASYDGSAKRAALAVRPMGPPQVTINPVQVIGGQSAAGQVTIPCPAGPGGLVITLSSSSPSVSIPASVTVPPGAVTAAFPILTFRVAAATSVTISAGPPGASMASLQLLPPSIPAPAPVPPAPASTALSLFPNPVPGGLLALGEVTLSQPAGPGGVTVTLTSSVPIAAVPATITLLPGASAATFPIITFPVTQPASVTITAASSFGSASATLQLLPLGGVPVTASNLLVNGSFEEPHVPDGNAIGGVSGNGLPGWRITRGTVDVISGYWQPAPDGGSQSIDLVGTPGAATIEQTFPTEPGRTYLFSGWVSHNWGISEGRANVSLNGAPLVQLYHNIPNSAQDMHWTHFSYSFQATAPATTLSIADVTNIDAVHGTALDGLSVTLAQDQNPPLAAAGAPAAPTGLAVTAVSANQVSLAWTDNSPSETAVAVWRKGGGADWARVGALAPHTTTFTDTGLAPNTTYTYRARAIGGNIASDWSNEVTVTTPAGA